MIAYHCGQRVVPKSDNPVYFKVQCIVCKRIFRQRKRKSVVRTSRVIRVDDKSTSSD